jgi:hypothetical protein
VADLIFQVDIGASCKLYKFCQKSVAAYAKSIGADHIVQTEAKLKIAPHPLRSGRSKEATAKHGGFLPIFEKSQALSHLGDYDRIAIIDSDIWIRPGSPNIFDQLGNADFAAVRERDTPSDAQHRRKIKGYSRIFKLIEGAGWDWEDGVANFWNCGMMLIGNDFSKYLKGQTPKEFLSRPVFRDFIDGVGPFKWSTDQLLYNTWARRCGMAIKHLDYKWNCLYGASLPEKMKKAYFVHFYLSDHLPSKGENTKVLEEAIS